MKISSLNPLSFENLIIMNIRALPMTRGKSWSNFVFSSCVTSIHILDIFGDKVYTLSTNFFFWTSFPFLNMFIFALGDSCRIKKAFKTLNSNYTVVQNVLKLYNTAFTIRIRRTSRE